MALTGTFPDSDNERLFGVMGLKGNEVLEFPNTTLFLLPRSTVRARAGLVIQVDLSTDEKTLVVSAPGKRTLPSGQGDEYVKYVRSLCDKGKCLDLYSSAKILEEPEAALKACEKTPLSQECRALYSNLEQYDLPPGVGWGVPGQCDSDPCAKPECFTLPRERLSNTAAKRMAQCRISHEVFRVDGREVAPGSSIELSGRREGQRAVLPREQRPFSFVGAVICMSSLLAVLLVRSALKK